MQKLPISICILSWKNEITLKNTLKSYKKNGLLKISDDIIVLFQEVSKKDIQIAEKYGIKHINLHENIGIGKGIIQLFENAKYETVLFLENDWELIENQTELFDQLNSGIEMLESGYDVVRYRSRKNPGYPLHSLKHKGNELDYYDDWHECTSPHLLESLHWLDPSKEFPDKIQKKGTYFVTTSRWANWTNNPFLINNFFYLEKLAPYAGTSVQFEKNIASWWVKQNFKIAQGEGLFTHNDLKKHAKDAAIIQFLKRIKNKIQKMLR